MRRYDDPVEVRRGMVPGPGGRQEGPEQFLWRGRLWKVCDVVAHWVETGAWWSSTRVSAAPGGEGGDSERDDSERDDSERDDSERDDFVRGPLRTRTDLTAEREVWRVEAARGLAAASAAGSGTGMFELTFDWADGCWRLTRCAD